MTSRTFAVGEVDEYLCLVSAVDAGSGTDGVGHSHAYSKSEPLDIEAGRNREITRWSTDIDEIAWRRAWGLFDRSEPVGYLYLAGGALRSELHRVNMGMGILREHRRQGGGAQLLEMGIEWAQEQPSIDWIDLGVFSDNPGATALYLGHGFEVLGRTSDRFRVDGVTLDEISMTRNVSRISE
jgi:RimJ/RimL family protein N-acetyltransferase